MTVKELIIKLIDLDLNSKVVLSNRISLEDTYVNIDSIEVKKAKLHDLGIFVETGTKYDTESECLSEGVEKIVVLK